MNHARMLTAGDLARALGGAVTPAVDRAVRRRAEDVARAAQEAAGDGIVTRISRQESGDYVVSVAGQGLPAREFGALDAPGDAAIADAVAGLKR